MKLIKYCFVFFFVFSKSSLALVITGDDALNFTGSEEVVYLLDSSSITTQTNSNIDFLLAYDTSSVNVLGGDIGFIFARNNSTTNVSGGNISWLQTYDNSTTNIESLSKLSWLVVDNASVVNIFGSKFNYDRGHLSGSWINGNSFSFWAVDEKGARSGNIGVLPSNIVLHEVPEPLPIMLLIVGLAGIFYRRKFSSRVI